MLIRTLGRKETKTKNTAETNDTGERNEHNTLIRDDVNKTIIFLQLLV